MPETAIRSIWLVWWLSWMAAALWRDRTVSTPGRQHQIAYRLLAGAGAVLLFGLYQHDLRSEMILWHTPVSLAWPLVAITVAGLLFTWWARIHLGRLWSSSVTRKADRSPT